MDLEDREKYLMCSGRNLYIKMDLEDREKILDGVFRWIFVRRKMVLEESEKYLKLAARGLYVDWGEYLVLEGHTCGSNCT